MPEYEESTPRKEPGNHYTPSTDASAKPKSRRRSAGFKSQTPDTGKNAGPAKIDPKEALKSEKLSGPTAETKHADGDNPTETRRRPENPAPKADNGKSAGEKTERPASHRGKSGPGTKHKTPAGNPDRETADREKNPEPSEATLEAIRRVEARIADRQAKREAKRKHTKTPGAQSRGGNARSGSGEASRRGGDGASGPVAAVAGFFRKLFGGADTNGPSESGPHRNGDKSRKSGAKPGNGGRGGQNRGSGRNGPRGGGGDRSRHRGGQQRSGGGRRRNPAKSDSRSKS